MDVIELLERLGSLGIGSFLRYDAERERKPWTFFASRGALGDNVIHLDADTADRCLELAISYLLKAGIDLG